MDKKKIIGVKLYHYIYSLVIVLLVLVLVYMFVKLKKVSTDVPLQANETTTEIVPQQPVESDPELDYKYSQKYYIIVFYGLVALILFFLTTPIFKNHTNILIPIIFCFMFSIVSLMKDHLTTSQKISLILYLCTVPLTIVALLYYRYKNRPMYLSRNIFPYPLNSQSSSGKGMTNKFFF